MPCLVDNGHSALPTMNTRFVPIWFVLFTLIAWAIGCQRSTQITHESSSPAIEQPVELAAVAVAQPVVEDESEKVRTVAATPHEPEPAELAIASTFQPPFPDRQDMFSPPKRAQSASRRTDETGEAIELKGFVNVDGPQVVLAIDGVISPIPEGGEKYGVHVISIKPPSVVLQRGRNRWTATLE